ncbi:MAG: DUF2955 domain-containing protein [Gammaproteobacteria bacterium]|nr:MAG: DUF2955 domain-containing protein [Gammaproteobacteria bacterium]
MPVAARRVFRLSFTMALALACGYGFGVDLPFLAPIFALMLTATPGPPMPPKKLVVLVLAITLILAVGLLLIRVLEHYPMSGILIVMCGIYLSSYMAVNLGKGPVAVFLTMSLTLISAMGLMDWGIAASLIDAIGLGLIIAIVSQWVVYPFFPEEQGLVIPEPPPPTPQENNWIALRATIIIMPVYLLMLTNPAAYAPIMMKSVTLGQQGSMVSAREAGRELLGSTFLGGCFALLIWKALGISTNLWMFFLWILLFGVFFAGKLYQVFSSRYPASFWSNVAVTALILLGSAVQDSETGKDVYTAFAVRMGLFIAVTLYAWLAIAVLERYRTRGLAVRWVPSN